MRGALLQPSPDLGHSGSIGCSKTGVRAMDSVNPSYGGSGVQKRGKGFTQTKTRHSKCSRDSAIDHFNAPEKPKRVRLKQVGGASSNGQVGMEAEIRVVCPFHRYDPKAYRLSSCKGKGFSELAKMKDHFKQVHGSSQEVRDADLNFKKKEYTSLKTLEEKWKLVYRRLFPHVPEHQVPSPHANEEEYPDFSDAFCHELAGELIKKVSLMVNEKVSRKAYDIPGEIMKDIVVSSVRKVNDRRRTFTRSTSVDSAVYFEIKESKATKVDEPATPPPMSHEGSPRITIDEGYCEPSPRLANEALTEPVAHAQSAAGSWLSDWGLGGGSTFANGGRWETGLQPSWAVSTTQFMPSESGPYFGSSLEYTAQSGSDTYTVSAPLSHQGYAPPDINTSPFSTSIYQTNASSSYYDSIAAPINCNQQPRFLLDKPSESLPAIHTSLEEQSQGRASPLPPSTCLEGLNGDLGMEDWLQTGVFSADACSYHGPGKMDFA